MRMIEIFTMERFPKSAAMVSGVLPVALSLCLGFALWSSSSLTMARVPFAAAAWRGVWPCQSQQH